LEHDIIRTLITTGNTTQNQSHTNRISLRIILNLIFHKWSCSLFIKLLVIILLKLHITKI